MIFGIVERHELACHKRQRIGKRLRLGARPENRNLDDLDVSRQRQRAERIERITVVRFADELDVEFRLRPVDLFQRRDEFRHQFGFAIERDQYRIDRQLRCRHGRCSS